MESYEFEGKTAEDAINKASLELNISPEDLEFEIIEPGSAGIFGLVGTRKTKIRVTIKETDDDDEDDAFKDYEDLEHFDSHTDDDTEKVDDDYDDDYDENSEDNADDADYTPFLNIARDALDNILKLIPVEASVKGSSTKGKISLIIEGDTSGILIGRKGKTLDALQYIINKITNKNTDKKIKVIIDSENYRQRRVDSLTQMALKIGNKAKKYKKPFSTSPLNPHDRRIVHLALKNVEKLETRSRGEGLLKRVIIIPKR